MWNEVLDVPTNDTHRGTAGPKILIEALDFINAHLNKQECSPAHESRTRKAKDAIEELLKEYTSPGTENIIYAGRCFLCGVTSMNKGVLTRHFKDQHFPQFEYSCPKEDCQKKQHRKDKIQNHIRAHEGIKRESIITKEFACPAQCTICTLTTNSWDEFYACIIGHHKVGAQQPERAVSRNSSVDHGQAPQMGSVPTINPPLFVSSQQLTVPGPGSVRSERSPSNAAGSQHRSEPVRIGRSHSDSQRAERNRINSNSSRSTAHIGGRLRGSQHSRGRNPYPQPTQSNEIVRGRIFGQSEPSNRNTRRLQCADCLESFRECDLGLTDGPRYYCPGCFTRRSFGSCTVPMGAQYSQQPQPSLDTAVSPLDIFPYYWTHETFSTRQDTTQPFPTTQFNEGQRNPSVSNRAAAFRSSQGSPPQSNDVNNFGIWAVRHIDSPTFSEEELPLCSPSSLGSKLTPTSPLASAFPWTKTLPIGLPTKPLKDLPTIPSSWLDNSKYRVAPAPV
ncbi:hypothetical protein N7481_012403 [Penicillium waksmanii]|uniref:uncharacterized protein n=1 Tax=Penicillium waksmanii TaxID=69791 RepID=UPI0025487D76|nr:uncharacterized protein N7481_012403 [Penicillium waksmanii]KAJ5965689.1 hypothetical protein N7481_012403 [Penicillium waksmanii]